MRCRSLMVSVFSFRVSSGRAGLRHRVACNCGLPSGLFGLPSGFLVFRRTQGGAAAAAVAAGKGTKSYLVVAKLTPVLARARAFLPQLAAANEDLLARAREDPESVSIENPSGAHVAMDLGVGVFDVKGEQNGVPGNVPVVEGEEWTKGDSSDSDSSSDSSDGEEAEEVQIREARTTKKAEEKK